MKTRGSMALVTLANHWIKIPAFHNLLKFPPEVGQLGKALRGLTCRVNDETVVSEICGHATGRQGKHM